MPRRWMRYEDLPYVAAPPGVCRWCGKVCPGRRTAWCSDDCVGEYTIRSSGSSARARVFERDGGACCACGLDTAELQERLRSMHNKLQQLAEKLADDYALTLAQRYGSDEGVIRTRRSPEFRAGYDAIVEFMLEMIECGFSRCIGIVCSIAYGQIPAFTRTLWEANHVTPVIFGGGMCGLDGLETLCVPCHNEDSQDVCRRVRAVKRGKPFPVVRPNEIVR